MKTKYCMLKYSKEPSKCNACFFPNVLFIEMVVVFKEFMKIALSIILLEFIKHIDWIFLPKTRQMEKDQVNGDICFAINNKEKF